MNRGRTPTKQVTSEAPRRPRSLSSGRCSPGPKKDTIINKLTKDELVTAYTTKLRLEGTSAEGVEDMTKKQIGAKMSHDELIQTAEVLGFFSKPCPVPRSKRTAVVKSDDNSTNNSSEQTVRPLQTSVLSARAPMAPVSAARSDSSRKTNALAAREPPVAEVSSSRKTPFPKVVRNCDTCTYATKKTLVNAMKKDHIAVAILLTGDPEAKQAVEYALCSGDYEKGLTKSKLETMIKADQLRSAALEMVEDRQLTVPEKVRDELEQLAVRCNLPRIEAAKETAKKLPAESIERQRLEHLTRQRPRGPAGRRAPGSVDPPRRAIPVPSASKRVPPSAGSSAAAAAAPAKVSQTFTNFGPAGTIAAAPIQESQAAVLGQARGAYNTLRVATNATPADIRKAYMNAVKDKNARMPYINRAFDLLYDQQKRAIYDQFGWPGVVKCERVGDCRPHGTSYLYGVLAVQPGAGQDVVNRAFKQAVLQYHPDKGGHVAQFALVNLAGDVLRDEERRKQYDTQGPNVLKADAQLAAQRAGAPTMAAAAAAPPATQCEKQDWYDCSDPCRWYFVEDPLTGECMGKEQYDAKMSARQAEEQAEKERELAKQQQQQEAFGKGYAEMQMKSDLGSLYAKKQLTECQKNSYVDCQKPCQWTGSTRWDGECVSGDEYKRRFPDSNQTTFMGALAQALGRSA